MSRGLTTRIETSVRKAPLALESASGNGIGTSNGLKRAPARIHYLRDGCTYGHRQRCMESMLRCLPFRNAPTTQAQSNRQPCKTGELSPARSFPARCCCPFGRSAC
ncbi:hypothetical protein UY3_19206 [Chelonia mydas]|uniref:Uncharacterized protein n=1 Tax=Chelonia mydas TaxID=8469 RepID=M7AHG1_CHEMY|nr:hypothetical protein UY3_19206 [Chelonia mydas]